MTGSLVSPYCFAEFHSVHAWHHPVAYNECHFVSFSLFSASIPSSAVSMLYLSARLLERKFNISSLSSTISMVGLCLIGEPERSSCKIPSGMAGLFNSDVPVSCGRTCACSIGNVTIKDDPLLTSDSTSIQPLCDSTIL